MVSLPDCQFSYMQEKAQKPNFFFKDVELTASGFRFTEFEEFEVNDLMPQTIRRLSSFDYEICMNDFFIVIVGIRRRSVTIIYKKNLKYVKTEDDIPNSYPPPYFLDAFCFNKHIEGRYYLYLRLLEAERVKLTFDSYIQKIVFNGDQIFFMFKTFIFIYTPLATCTLDIAAIDIAVNFYLYVLTADRILVYNEELYKTIDIDKKCRFIVPTPAHIFVIKSSFIYKIVDDKAELYFDTLHHVRDVVFDDQHMYLATKFSVMKVGLYEASPESISIKVLSPRLKLCDDYIILHNTSNGVGFIDKKNLQRFCFKLLNWNMVGMTAHRNEVAYLGSEELRLFKFAEIDGNLEPVSKLRKQERESFVNEPVKLRLPSEIYGLINDKLGPHPYDYYGMAFNSVKFQAFESLRSFNSDQQKEFDEDLKKLLDEAENDTSQLPHTEDAHGLPIAGDAAEYASQVLDALAAKQRKGDLDIHPSPPLTVPSQNHVPKKAGIRKSPLENKTPEEAKCLMKILKGNSFLDRRKLNPREDTASEESSSGLFFDDSEHLESKELQKDFLLLHIARKRKSSNPRPAKKARQRFYSAFIRAQSRYTVNNPYTHHDPLEAFDGGHMKLIRFSRKYETYQRTSFFCKNHFKFFKDRFKPRNEEEKVPKYHIYNLIDDEFKKIIGYRPDKDRKVEKKIDLSKRTRGGF